MELDAVIARLHAERTQRAIAEQAERYAQIDAARDAEIQRLIAEAEAETEDEPQVIPAGRRESIIAALRSYTGPLTKNGLPKRKALNAHAGFMILRAGKSANAGRRRKVVIKRFNPFSRHDWEKAGDKIEDAAEQVGDAFKDTAEDAGKKLNPLAEQALDAAEEAVKKALQHLVAVAAKGTLNKAVDLAQTCCTGHHEAQDIGRVHGDR